MNILLSPGGLFLSILLIGIAGFEIIRLAIPHFSSSVLTPGLFGAMITMLDAAHSVDWTVFASKQQAYAIGLAILAFIWWMRKRTGRLTGLNRFVGAGGAR